MEIIDWILIFFAVLIVFILIWNFLRPKRTRRISLR